jgi:aspartate dehydrogenase
MRADTLSVVFVGWGAINARVWQLLAARPLNIKVVAVATRNAAKSRNIPMNALSIDRPEDLVDLSPQLVVEAASRAAVEIWGPIALRVSKAAIFCSTGAFTDSSLLARLRKVSDQFGSSIIIPTGAIGAMDALSSAAMLRLSEVIHRISKPPDAWRGTNAERLLDLSTLSVQTTIFSGTAREAAEAFPQNANATVVTSLAGVGLERTIVELVVDPLIKRNRHTISARGDFGNFTFTLENEPLKGNPKSSELTALNLARLIEEQAKQIGVAI